MYALLNVLERERERLDQLRFRLVETRLLLAAGEVRYLRWAAAEVEQAWLRVDRLDVQRSHTVRRIVVEAARKNPPTLRELANQTVAPMAGILRDHHEGLCAIVSEIEVLSFRNAELARRGIQELAEAGLQDSAVPEWATRATVRVVLPDAEALLAEGGDVTALDSEGAYQEVITGTTHLRMPSLLAFLR